MGHGPWRSDCAPRRPASSSCTGTAATGALLTSSPFTCFPGSRWGLSPFLSGGSCPPGATFPEASRAFSSPPRRIHSRAVCRRTPAAGPGGALHLRGVLLLLAGGCSARRARPGSVVQVRGGDPARAARGLLEPARLGGPVLGPGVHCTPGGVRPGARRRGAVHTADGGGWLGLRRRHFRGPASGGAEGRRSGQGPPRGDGLPGEARAGRGDPSPRRPLRKAAGGAVRGPAVEQGG